MPLRILNVICAYNEIDYLPYVLDFYEQEGIDMYVIDNYSSDGTWEHLQSRGVPSRQLDTDGAFDLRALQTARVEVYRRLGPDWVIYGDADEFILMPRPLREVVEEADTRGYSALKLRTNEFYNTGEVRKNLDPRQQFFWFSPRPKPLERIHKNVRGLRYRADSVRATGKRTQFCEGAVWNYGSTKPATSRAETLERRRRAWQRGLNRSYGAHYLLHESRGWSWRREELLDIRLTLDWQYHLQRESSDRRSPVPADPAGDA